MAQVVDEPNKIKSKPNRKRKLPPEESFGEKDQINNLPDDILLHILGHLPVKERCIACRVCRRWSRIISDNSLWKHVDLLAYKLNLTKMWKIFRAHFSECLLTMKIKGYVRSGLSKDKKPSISDAMLKELSKRCPNLHTLQLHRCQASYLTFESLPTSLKSLAITDCIYSSGWFREKHSHLPHLISLDLTNTVRIDRHDLKSIANFTNLKSLNISGCPRINPGDMDIITKGIPGLESLVLSRNKLNDLDCHHIARDLKDLKHLQLYRYYLLLTDSGLATLATGLKKLENLDIFDIKAGSSGSLDGYGNLSTLTKLKRFVLRLDTASTSRQVESVKAAFPQSVEVDVVCENSSLPISTVEDL